MARHVGSQGPDPVGFDTCDRSSPIGGFGDPVCLTEEIGTKAIPAVTVGGEEALVMVPGHQETVGETKHDRRIRRRPHSNPLCLRRLDQIFLQGREVDEPHPTIPTGLQPRREHVAPLAAVLDLAVLDRHPAERNHQFGVLCDLGVLGLLVHAVVEGETEDVGRDDVSRRDRVVID